MLLALLPAAASSEPFLGVGLAAVPGFLFVAGVFFCWAGFSVGLIPLTPSVELLTVSLSFSSAVLPPSAFIVPLLLILASSIAKSLFDVNATF